MIKLSTNRRSELFEFSDKIGIRFKDLSLLNQAFVHSSYIHENGLDPLESNERLEFLGDGVLGIATTEHLYKKHPNYHEGDLTKIKSAVVSKPVLAKESARMNLGKYILLGKGEERSGGRQRDSTLANAFEAIIGAIFLDSGFYTAKDFLRENFLQKLEEKEKEAEDYKSQLQEVLQAKYNKRPVYVVAGHTGPEHSKTFLVKALVKGRLLGKGKGASKKEAEQMAAKEALKKLESEKTADKGEV